MHACILLQEVSYNLVFAIADTLGEGHNTWEVPYFHFTQVLEQCTLRV